MQLRPVIWVGSSKEDLKTFPADVQDRVGFALYQAQIGLRHRDTKTLRGMGSHVLEIVSRYDSDTYRTVYAVRFRSALYVLHAFRKKAKKGIATPKQDVDVIRQRLKVAKKHYEDTYGKGRDNG